MNNVEWIKDQYENAKRPFSGSRSEELRIITKYGEHYGRTIDEASFDTAIADLFSGGTEFEWTRD